MSPAPMRAAEREAVQTSLRRQLVVAIVVLLVAWVTLQSRGDSDTQTARSPSADPVAGLPESSFDVSARGVETNATITGIANLALDGMPSVSIQGRLPGDPPSTVRTFSASDRGFTLRGRDMSLDVTTLVRPNEVRVTELPGSHTNMALRGRVTLLAAEITVQKTGDPEPAVRRGSVTFIANGTGRLGTGRLSTPLGVRWTDAPKTIRFSDEQRTITDWAGSGTVRVGGRDYTHEFGALAARGLDATVKREPGKVTATGRARVQQVYLDGEPQLRTTATCDLVQIREETYAGRSLELTWAPRNTGDFDMVMTRIVPIGPSAHWLSLGLEGLIDEFGGEMRPRRRGDTRGFRDGAAIRSVLPPFDADRRDIGVEVPHDTPNGTYDASVRIEGNFDPVVVPFEVIVVDAPEPRST